MPATAPDAPSAAAVPATPIDLSPDQIRFQDFTALTTPFTLLSAQDRDRLTLAVHRRTVPDGTIILDFGQQVETVQLIHSGAVDVITRQGFQLARVVPGGLTGAKAQLTNGIAKHQSIAVGETSLFEMPGALFRAIAEANPEFQRHFAAAAIGQAAVGDRSPARPSGGTGEGLLAQSIQHLMSPNPATIGPDAPASEAARIMRDRDISCLLVVDADQRLVGLVTTGDMTDRIVADGADGTTPVGQIMTPTPITLTGDALGFDVLVPMTEKGLGHLPIVDEAHRPIGILTRTNLVRQQSGSALYLVADLAHRDSIEGMAKVTARLPALLTQLVGAGVPPHQIGRIMTSVTDALTRRLIALAEAEIGPAPVAWCWAACGSQGREEQTGVSDQDTALILGNDFNKAEHGAWAEALARFVSDGLNACGFIYCPGEMMAITPRWRQPVSVWRSYFDKWIDQPDPMAQMLASVMFDLRPIAGDTSLFSALQADTLQRASENSIFRAHMASNALTHTPPLTLFGGLSVARSGEHKNTIDLKHNGVVPIVDLARFYALEAQLTPVNTRERLNAAIEAGAVSRSGGRDLLDAFDLISSLRLEHQAARIRSGLKADNFLNPTTLSDLERAHLKDAFYAIKTLQSALGQSRGAVR